MRKEIPGHMTGTIYSWTVMRKALPEYKYLEPYVVGLVDVDLPGGGKRRMIMKVTDLDFNQMGPGEVGSQIKIGDRVEIVTRKAGEGGERGVLPYIFTARLPIDNDYGEDSSC
jgi:uncharacterized OB-fold protein